MDTIGVLIDSFSQSEIESFIKSHNVCDSPSKNYECCDECYSRVWGKCPICYLKGEAFLDYKYDCVGTVNELCEKHNAAHLVRYLMAKKEIEKDLRQYIALCE